MERLRAIGPLVLVCLLGLWPFLYVLPLWPESRDAVVWITRGSPWSGGWATWVFASDHFIGWRPVTALSYTLDGLFGIATAWPYRATDLALHAACAVGVDAVYRRWRPDLPRWGGWLAAAVVMVHPVASVVVPHLARRGYSLSSALGLLAIFLALGPRRRLMEISLALVGAAGANEGGFLYFPLVAWLLKRDVDRRTWAKQVGALVAVAVVLLLARFAAIHGLGGYHFDEAAGSGAIAWSLIEGLLGGAVMRSDVGGLPVAATLGLGTLAVAGLAPLRHEQREPWLMCVAWAAAIVALLATQGVYFPRQVYLLLPPFALAVGFAAAGGGVAQRAALAVAFAGVLWQSPVLRGPDRLQFATWRAHDRLLRDLHAEVATLPSSTLVHTVLPNFRRPEVEALRAHEPDEEKVRGRHMVQWIAALTDVKFGDLATITTTPGEGPIATPGEGAATWVPAGRRLAVTAGMRVDETPEGAFVTPTTPPKRGQTPWLYVHDGLGGHFRPLEGAP